MTTATVAIIPSAWSVDGPWIAAVRAGGHVSLIPLGLDRAGQPDLRPLLDLLDMNDSGVTRKLVVVLARLQDRDDLECLCSYVQCSFAGTRTEIVALADADVAKLLGVPEDVANPLDPAAVRPVVEHDLGARPPKNLDAGALRAMAFVTAGTRELSRRQARVRVVGTPRGSPTSADKSPTKDKAPEKLTGRHRIVALLAMEAGFRPGELRAARIEWLRWKERAIIIPHCQEFSPKGGRPRPLPMSKLPYAELWAWVGDRASGLPFPPTRRQRVGSGFAVWRVIKALRKAGAITHGYRTSGTTTPPAWPPPVWVSGTSRS